MAKLIPTASGRVVGALVLALVACDDGTTRGTQVDESPALPGDTTSPNAGTMDAASAPGAPLPDGSTLTTPDAGPPPPVQTVPDASTGDAASVDAAAPDAGEQHASFERLLVADAVEPVARIVDVEPDAVHASYNLAGIARVYAGSTGAYGYAVQGEADVVSVLSSGLSVVDHDDHVHEEREDASLLDYRLEGDYPVHFVAHDGLVALFFDNIGRAHVLDEATLGSATPRVRIVDSGMPHHGVALTFHDHILITVPELLNGATRATPVGIAVHDATGAATGQKFVGCTSLHGEATRDSFAAFGCAEGVLVVESSTQGFSGRVIPNPASTVTPAPRVGTLVGHHALPHFVGNFGAGALSAIDATSATITPHSVPEPYVQFDVDPSGEHIVLLTRKGELRILDARTFELGPLFAVTSAVTDDTGHGARYPQFGFGEHLLYVTDPARGQIHAVDLESQTVQRSLSVPGVPAKLTVLRPDAGDDRHDH